MSLFREVSTWGLPILRNIIEHNVLIESTDTELGHEFSDPGVYTSPLMVTAKGCPCWES